MLLNDARGVSGAAMVAAFALLQATIFVATVVAIDKLAVGAGCGLALALEEISATTVAVWLKVGPEFGKVTFAYQMGVLLGFTPLLVYVQDFGWPLSLMLASFTVVVSGTALCVAMVKGGMVTGFRAVFVSFLTVLQINLVLNAIVTFELPAQLTLIVNAGCYVGLLLTLLVGLRRDDGAGRLYGSGVEVFYFVCGVLLLGTGTTAGLYFMVPTVEDATAQLAGVTMGGVVLCCPVIARALGNSNTVKVTPLAVPQPGSCGSSGRAWRL